MMIHSFPSWEKKLSISYWWDNFSHGLHKAHNYAEGFPNRHTSSVAQYLLVNCLSEISHTNLKEFASNILSFAEIIQELHSISIIAVLTYRSSYSFWEVAQRYSWLYPFSKAQFYCVLYFLRNRGYGKQNNGTLQDKCGPTSPFSAVLSYLMSNPLKSPLALSSS